MTRGDLWWADFGISFGRESGFRRPVLVVPLTTNLVLEEAPESVFLSKAESSLTKDSVIVVTQLLAIDKKRLIENIATVTRETMEDVETGVTLVLGIA